MVVLKCHGSFGGITRSKVICLCLFFGFVVIEWCAVGIWKAFTSRLKFAKWSDWCLDEHPLHTGRCFEYQYQVWNGGKQYHHVSPPNHELQADIWTFTVHFICFQLFNITIYVETASKTWQGAGEGREGSAGSGASASGAAEELPNGYLYDCHVLYCHLPLDISMASVSTKGILTILYSGWGKYVVCHSNSWSIKVWIGDGM